MTNYDVSLITLDFGTGGMPTLLRGENSPPVQIGDLEGKRFQSSSLDDPNLNVSSKTPDETDIGDMLAINCVNFGNLELGIKQGRFGALCWFFDHQRKVWQQIPDHEGFLPPPSNNILFLVGGSQYEPQSEPDAFVCNLYLDKTAVCCLEVSEGIVHLEEGGSFFGGV